MHSQFQTSFAAAALAACLVFTGNAVVLAASPIVVKSMSPRSGPLGTVITITGSGFLGAASADSGLGVSLPTGHWVRDGAVTVISATEVQYKMPNDGGTGQIYIGNPQGGRGWSPFLFTVTGGAATTAPSVPPVPSGLAASAGNAQVSLSWSTDAGASGYHVKRAVTSGGPYTQVSAPTSPVDNDTSLTNGTKYYYVVSAVSSSGESANSSQIMAAPSAPTKVPPVPSGFAASAGNTQVSLSWSADAGASSYHVKRATTSGGPYTQVAAPASPTDNDTSLTNGTTYYYVVSAVDSAGESANSAQVSAAPSGATVSANLTVTVNPSSRQPISPYVYGINFSKSFLFPTSAPAPSGATLDRMGGDRMTAYNWTTNASNSGSDGSYTNDANFPGSTPAGAVSSFISADQAAGMATLVTFQMQGLVSGDEAGAVSLSNAPDLARFKSVQFAKGAAFAPTAPALTGSVFMDEQAVAIDDHFGGQGIFSSSANTHPVFASLDNEPDIWGSTHKELGPEPSAATFNAKTVALAAALKNQYPQMTIFGGVISGFYGLYSWNGTLSTTVGGANWFVDDYAAAVKAANTAAGKTLVDVFDFHWYSQITDPVTGGQINSTNSASLTAAQVQAIVQSPRSLWDTTFKENSWITSAIGTPIYIIPRLQAKIAAADPGMKMAITEYYNGGGNHIAGTIAQADNLGIYGAYGLFAACLWPLGSDPYVVAAFKAYRNFDGAGHNFGDTSVAATSNNIANVAAYVSTDSTRPGRVVMVLINRSVSAQATAVTGQPLTGTAHLFQTTATTASQQGSNIAPVAAGTQAVSGSSITVNLPALSVTTVDIY
jgi:fibronectin type 3 domain-containing protein